MIIGIADEYCSTTKFVKAINDIYLQNNNTYTIRNMEETFLADGICENDISSKVGLIISKDDNEQYESVRTDDIFVPCWSYFEWDGKCYCY